jgi:hypothetical protein
LPTTVTMSFRTSRSHSRWRSRRGHRRCLPRAAHNTDAVKAVVTHRRAVLLGLGLSLGMGASSANATNSFGSGLDDEDSPLIQGGCSLTSLRRTRPVVHPFVPAGNERLLHVALSNPNPNVARTPQSCWRAQKRTKRSTTRSAWTTTTSATSGCVWWDRCWFSMRIVSCL